MAVITGGAVSPPGVVTPGVRPPIYCTKGAPTDAAVSNQFIPADGALAVDVTNGQVYERQSGAWTRIDTV